ncbi:hypothetical protein V9T40_005055 [Parthenolecanium corni]|uniref:Flavin-containing monooxygenase n=1 Tax=Parthenolecanium corni TaxID=536013 RepID=A0AAN9TDF2_9HEMI
MSTNKPQVAIIGCGYSGLAGIRRCREFGVDCVAFELANEVGGLWVYKEEIGEDEYGVPIQTSLYQSVRTNSPKQTLEFPDFPFITKEDTCYPRHTEVGRYLNEFSQHFGLLPKIKFQHYVTCIKRVADQWELLVTNLRDGTNETYYFDGVMICNGHTAKPHMPNVKGSNRFKGRILHCHDYRRNDIFKNKKVLIVGKGPSGIELAYESSLVAMATYISCRSEDGSSLPKVISKPKIKEIKECQVIFTDESQEFVDIIVFCTGYQYYFPFLDDSCGISVDEDGQVINSLYKHFINIEQPTMCFIGLFQRTIISFLFDLQVQAFLKIFTKKISLPSKAEMLEWLKNENDRQKRNNIPKNRYYHLSANIVEYFEDLTTFARLKNIPPVLFKIFRQNERTYTENFYELRRWNFEILDDYNYKATLKQTEY